LGPGNFGFCYLQQQYGNFHTILLEDDSLECLLYV
jgi:hypothetical protein